MGNYSQIDTILRNATHAKILLLDNNNLQFYYQYEDVLPKSEMFAPYDLVLIPGWVQAEYAHHARKSNYISNIPVPTYVIDEFEDYLPLLEYNDLKLLALFRLSSVHSEALQFFGRYRHLHAEELPDDWLEQFYDHGFTTKQTNTRITKKNAGEVSLVTLCFCLLHHYHTQIQHLTIASTDFGIIKIKDRVLQESQHDPFYGCFSAYPPISFLSTDVSIYCAVKQGTLAIQDIPRLRPNPKSAQYIQHHADYTSTLHSHVLTLDQFMVICNDTDNYTFIF